MRSELFSSFFVFFVSFIGLCIAEPITLTAEDGSYLIHGARLKRIQNITVVNDCADCVIFVQLWAKDQKDTSFTVTDSTGSVSSQVLTGQYFGSSVIVDFEDNNNFIFILSFTRSTEKSKDAKRDLVHTIQPLETNSTYTSTFKATTTEQAYSFVSLINQPTYTVSAKDLTANCTIDLYLSGIPSDAGKEKYRLFEFNSTTLAIYRTSTVRSPAITYMIPPNCEGSLIVDSSLQGQVDAIDHTSMGFMMSAEYPGNFAASADVNPHPSISMNATWNDEALIGVDVKSADPGTSGSLVIFTGDAEYNFTKAVNNADAGGLGTQFNVIWAPGQDTKSGFLLRYVIVKNEKKPTPKAASVLESLFFSTVALSFAAFRLI